MTITIVHDLLAKTGGKALVYDPSFAKLVVDVPFPDPSAFLRLPLPFLLCPNGTASGIPNPVPETHRWLKSQAQVQWPSIWQCYQDDRALVVNNIGSFANVGSATRIVAITYLSWSGHCLVQTSKPDFEVDEFLAMTLYATKETAGYLVSSLNVKEVLPAMRVLEDVNCKFIPTRGLDHTDLNMESSKRSQGGQLFDLFLPTEADNCPHPSISNRPDGHIMVTFSKKQNQDYIASVLNTMKRGRNDDWIRTGKHLSFCDTKLIEDNALTTCADFVENVAVVGHYKPAVVLFVEPINSIKGVEDEAALKAKILTRTRAFTDRLFEHEQVKSLVQIVTVDAGSLPRTTEKGNIRRKAVEDDHAKELEGIYASQDLAVATFSASDGLANNIRDSVPPAL
ncbi:hypothetical protein C8R44DRAFT_879044 [Mycena epipterygia]|nr:hypothetical protein C8R44DRAFT_879044 [Mycena epipterygia]